MKNIIKIIFLAAVSASLAILVEQCFGIAANVFWQKEIISDFYQNLTWFLALSVVIEEFSKYWAVSFVIRKNFEISGRKFVFASFFFGLLWGIFEIGLIFFSNPEIFQAFRAYEPQTMFSLESILALHALTAFLMGVFISSKTFSPPLRSAKTLFFPILIHLLYNFLIIQKSEFTNYLIIISLSLFYLIGIAIFAFNFRKLAQPKN